MSRKFFGLMAVAGVALAAGLGGVSQDAEAGFFGRMFGGHHGGDACGYGACGYAACGWGGGCGGGGDFEYDDDDAGGWAGCGHRGGGWSGCGGYGGGCGGYSGCGYASSCGCYSSCGPVYSAPVSYAAPACGACATSTCCSAPVSTCGSPCGGCGGYASSMSYGVGCPGGVCGVAPGVPVEGGYGVAPMPMGEGYIEGSVPQGEEAPAPPGEDDLPPENGAEQPPA